MQSEQHRNSGKRPTRPAAKGGTARSKKRRVLFLGPEYPNVNALFQVLADLNSLPAWYRRSLKAGKRTRQTYTGSR